MTDSSEWTGAVGDAWAAEWRRTDRSFGALTDRLLERALAEDYHAALDIGCGAGALVERLARADPAARVTGIDISSELIAAARARCAGLSNARLVEADAASWRPDAGFTPDLLVSRHGVMFFPDPAGAFSHLASQASGPARLVFSCFRSREDNAWAGLLASALPPQPAGDPSAPGPFAFADPRRVEAILSAAGWREIAFEAVDYAMIAGEGADAVDDALGYFQRIGPAARVLREMEGTDRSTSLARLRAVLEGCAGDGRVAMRAAAWIVSARL